MNKHQLFKYGIIAALLILWAVLIMPAMACEPQTCPRGEVWGISGSHQVWTDTSHWGSCQSCPADHQQQQCTDVLYWQTHKDIDTHRAYNNLGDCVSDLKHHSNNDAENTCKGVVDQDCNTVCNYDSTFRHDSCSGTKGQLWIVSGYWTTVYDHGCVAGCDYQHPCPEGQHCVDGQCVINPPTTCPDVPCETGYHCVNHECVPDVCGVNFQCDQGFHCGDDNTCVANPVEQSSAPPMQFIDPFWTGKDQQCAGLGSGNAIQLKSHDNEQLYVTLTHNGFFSAQVTTHDPESDDMFAQACKGRTYYRSTCSFQRLSSASTVSFTITGTRDFVVYAVPDIQTDNGVTTIQIINHDVDFSGVSDGRVLDMHFMRSEGMAGCPQGWLAGIKFYGPQ